MTIRGYQLAIDWSRNGIFNNSLEDVTTPGQGTVDKSDVIIEFGRSEARATEDPQVGKLSFALNNVNRVFSPENTSSPLAGKVVPGTPARFQVTVGGTISTLFQGPIDSFTVDPTSVARTFSASALDAWGALGSTVLSTDMQLGQRTGFLIDRILTLIGWTGGRDIDPGATVVAWWWAEGVDAVTAIADLVHSEGPNAIAYVRGGTFIFRDRYARLTKTLSTVSQGTYTHIKPSGSGPAGDFKILKDGFDYDHGLNNIVNSATLTVTPLVPTDFIPIWTLTGPVSMLAGEVRIIKAQMDDPFIATQIPVEGIDYHTVTGSVQPFIDRISGQSLNLMLTAGGSGFYTDTDMVMRGISLVAGDAVQVSAEDASSVGTFTRRTWDGSAPWANQYDAAAIVQQIVSVYGQARPSVTMTIANTFSKSSVATMTQIANRTVGDRVTIREDEMGLNADYMVERVTHTIQQLGLIHKLTLGCQVVDPVQATTALTFDVAGKGFNQGQFGIDGITNAASMFQFDTASHGFNDGTFGL